MAIAPRTRPLVRPVAAAPPGPAALLDDIRDPSDVRRLDRAQLHRLADELRAFLIETVSSTGGHLSSNLGTVELTLALHHVFDTPHDRLVWDVGHQAYGHKILTGRREAMARLRMHGGLSGFPKRSESEYDTFGTGHSSTSISAALGMALGSRLKGEPRDVVAVIGDGALSGGMAFEAMNNAGVSGADLLVVLNDNEMSISPAVGALTRYLARLLSGPYVRAREVAKEALATMGQPATQFARRAEEQIKGMVLPSTLFEHLGFHYVGPIDGHDLDALVPTLRNLKAKGGPRLLHVVTKKGQGYKLAEADPVRYHGVARFTPSIGLAAGAPAALPTYTEIFGDWICEAAARDPRLVAITPAMREGSGLVRFAGEFPARFFDVGIAEQHALTFAAGLACEGLRPVVAIYSTFLQRGYDQLVHDVALQDLPVVFAIDRAGLAGPDGATHHGAFDLSYLRCLPNVTVMTPADAGECRAMLDAGMALASPCAVRYPRSAASPARRDAAPIEIGKAEVRRRGRRVALLAFGPLLEPALAAGEALDATVVNMRFVKPLDTALVLELSRTHELLVTIEENAIDGGAGSAVAEAIGEHGHTVSLLQLGLPDRFVEHGDRPRLLAGAGLDADTLLSAIRRRLGVVPTTSRGEPSCESC
ncbi:MAG: 1-deoxy-D-xylulose-5-phosphate synthase [Betaproteobacteria bacterium]|nr:1-deoxy-D-xylulose-5-phosphate synthase [Betaproteobacteria bacterium]